MRRPEARQIDQQTSELLRSFGLFSVPVNVQEVATRLGAKVVYADLDDDVSGFLLRERKIITIAVNKSHHVNRQRFTIAHECGHLHLHADQGDRIWVDKQTTLFYRDADSSSGEQRAEIQANQFAAGLLMPELLLLDNLANEMREADVYQLALKFQVSEQSMLLRLGSLDVLRTA